MKIGLGRLPRLGQEHAVSLADGRGARPGPVARRAKRHGADSRSSPATTGRFIPFQKNHHRGDRNRRYARPEPQTRRQRHAHGNDPRGRLPGFRGGGLRQHRSAGRSALLRRRPAAGRHGNRLRPHPSRRGIAEKAHSPPGTPGPATRARSAKDRDGGDGVGQAAARSPHDRRTAQGHPRIPAVCRKNSGGDRQHGRRRTASRTVHPMGDRDRARAGHSRGLGSGTLENDARGSRRVRKGNGPW